MHCLLYLTLQSGRREPWFQHSPARLLYRFTSAFVHVRSHAFTLLVRAEGVTDPQTPGAVPLGLSLRDLMTWTAITAAAVDFAIQQCGQYFGWSLDRWHVEIRPMLRRWALTQG